MRPDGSSQIIKTQSFKAKYLEFPQSTRFTFKRFELENGWIYYKDFNNGGLYRFLTDGADEELVIAEPINDFFVGGEWVFYSTEDGLYKIRTEGTERTKLDDGSADKIMVLNGRVYFIRDGRLQRIHTDGTRDEAFAAIEGCNAYNMTDDTIYFLRKSDSTSDNCLLMRKIEGTEEKLIDDRSSSNISILGDGVYYTGLIKIEDDMPHFGVKRVHLDGTEWPMQ